VRAGPHLGGGPDFETGSDPAGPALVGAFRPPPALTGAISISGPQPPQIAVTPPPKRASVTPGISVAAPVLWQVRSWVAGTPRVVVYNSTGGWLVSTSVV